MKAVRPPDHTAHRDAAIVRAVARWFAIHKRPLPWRADDPVRGAGYRDPYRSLVSEFMLQQTQVARVLEKFEPFLSRFPTVQALAAAHEDEVLAAWTGLGYYRRARLLHAAARAIMETHNGTVPNSVDALQELPGVGRYTAGAIASMAHRQSAALVDTNVIRVILRVDAKTLDAAQAAPYVWNRAEYLASLAHRSRGLTAGEFNEGLMELGATACVAGSPRCEACPLAQARLCSAHARGRQSHIPRAKVKKARTAITHAVVLVQDRRGRFLLEQRPAQGLWAGLWQPPALELGSNEHTPRLPALLRRLALPRSSAAPLKPFVFHTSHREVRFVAWHMTIGASHTPRGRRWVAQSELSAHAMSSPVRSLVRAFERQD